MKPKCYTLFIILIFCAAPALAQSADASSPGQLVHQLEADLVTAKSRQVDVLSPGFFKESESALVKAKRGLEQGTKISTIKTLPENRILAAGYGPDRPLAPNTTPEGRAINRRIDVLIQPFAKK